MSSGQSVAAAPVRRRDIGVDVVRGVTLLMMYAAHVAPKPEPVPSRFVDYATFPLFALIVGVGAQLTEARARRTGERGHWWRSLVLRSLSLIGLGLWLEDLDPPVVVVLVHMGVLVALVSPLARVPDLPLVMLAVALFAVGPILRAEVSPPVMPMEFPGRLTDLALTGEHYRLSAMLLYAVLGILAMRWSRSGSGRDALIGAWLIVLSFAPVGLHKLGRVEMVPDSGTHLEVATTAVMALGTFLLVRWLGGALPMRLMTPLGWMGAMTFSLYVAHAVFLWWWTTEIRPGVSDDSWVTLLVLCLGSLGLASLWHLLVPRRPFVRGPLEGAITAVAR